MSEPLSFFHLSHAGQSSFRAEKSPAPSSVPVFAPRNADEDAYKVLFRKLQQAGLLDQEAKLLFSPHFEPHALDATSRQRMEDLLAKPIQISTREGRLLFELSQREYLLGFPAYLKEKLQLQFSTFLMGEAACYVANMTSYLEELIQNFLKHKGWPKDLFAEDLEEIKSSIHEPPQEVEWIDLLGSPPNADQLSAIRRCCIQFFVEQSKGKITAFQMEKEGFMNLLIPKPRPLFPPPEPYLLAMVGNPSEAKSTTTRRSGYVSCPSLFSRGHLLLPLDKLRGSPLVPKQTNFWQVVIDSTFGIDRMEERHHFDFRAAVQAIHDASRGYLVMENGCSIQSVISHVVQSCHSADLLVMIMHLVEEPIRKQPVDRLSYLFNITLHLHLEPKIQAHLPEIWKRVRELAAKQLVSLIPLEAKLLALFQNSALSFEDLAQALYHLAVLVTLFKHQSPLGSLWAEWGEKTTLHIGTARLIFPKEMAFRKAPDIVHQLLSLKELTPVGITALSKELQQKFYSLPIESPLLLIGMLSVHTPLTPALRSALDQLLLNPKYQAEREIIEGWLAPWKSESTPIILEAVQGTKVMQDLDLVLFSIGGEHSQKVKAIPVEKSSSREYVNLVPSTASRIIAEKSLELTPAQWEQKEPVVELLEKKNPTEEWEIFWGRSDIMEAPPSIAPLQDKLKTAASLEVLNKLSTLIASPHFEKCQRSKLPDLYSTLFSLAKDHLTSPKTSLRDPLLLRLVGRVLDLSLYSSHEVLTQQLLELLPAVWSKNLHNRLLPLLKRGRNSFVQQVEGAQLLSFLKILQLYQVPPCEEEALQTRCLLAFQKNEPKKLEDLVSLYQTVQAYLPHSFSHFQAAIHLLKKVLEKNIEVDPLLAACSELWSTCPEGQKMGSLWGIFGSATPESHPVLLKWALAIPLMDKKAIMKAFEERYRGVIITWPCAVHISCIERLAQGDEDLAAARGLLSLALKRSDLKLELGRVFPLLRKTGFTSLKELSVCFQYCLERNDSLARQPLSLLEELRAKNLLSPADPHYKSCWDLAIEAARKAPASYAQLLQLLENSALCRTLYPEPQGLQEKGREILAGIISAYKPKDSSEGQRLLNCRRQFSSSADWHSIDCQLICLLCQPALSSLLPEVFMLLHELLKGDFEDKEIYHAAFKQFLRHLTLQSRVMLQMEPQAMVLIFDMFYAFLTAPEEKTLLLRAISLLGRKELWACGVVLLEDLMKESTALDAHLVEDVLKKLLAENEIKRVPQLESLLQQKRLIALLPQESLTRLKMQHLPLSLERARSQNPLELTASLDHVMENMAEVVQQPVKPKQVLWTQALKSLAWLLLRYQQVDFFKYYFPLLFRHYMDLLPYPDAKTPSKVVLFQASHPLLKTFDLGLFTAIDTGEEFLIQCHLAHPAARFLGLNEAEIQPKDDKEVKKSLEIATQNFHKRAAQFLLQLLHEMRQIPVQSNNWPALDSFLLTLSFFLGHKVEQMVIDPYLSLLVELLYYHVQLLTDTHPRFPEHVSLFINMLINSDLLPIDKQIEVELISKCILSARTLKKIERGGNICINQQDAYFFRNHLERLLELKTPGGLMQAILTLNRNQTLFLTGFSQVFKESYKLLLREIDNFLYVELFDPLVPIVLMTHCFEGSNQASRGDKQLKEIRKMLFMELYEVAGRLVPKSKEEPIKKIITPLQLLLIGYKEDSFDNSQFQAKLIPLLAEGAKLSFALDIPLKEADLIFALLLENRGEQQAQAISRWIMALIKSGQKTHVNRLMTEGGISMLLSAELLGSMKEGDLQ